MRCQEEPSGTSVAIFTRTVCALAGTAQASHSPSATAAIRTASVARDGHAFIEPIGPPTPVTTSLHKKFIRARQQPPRALLIHQVRQPHVRHGVRVDGE